MHSQQCLFARKISSEATGLKSRLTALYLSPKSDFPVSQEGLHLHNFATQQGRLGQRHGARFWEQQSTIGQNRELLIVICQKWPVAQRLVSRVNARTEINAPAYMLNDDTVILPNLGKIQASLSQRNRHRKAPFRLVFNNNYDDQLLICLDPIDLDFIKNFCA